MAPPKTTSFFFFFFILRILGLNCCSADNFSCQFKSIYQLGDSISDTGNILRINPNVPSSRLPYGETFLKKPTGRFSDGRLMIDFIATALQLPFLNPYLHKNVAFQQGVNFAVAGSSALDNSFFAVRNVTMRSSNVPLNAQLQWFKDHLNSTCRAPTECEDMLRESLVLVGEIGGNDYSYSLTQGKSIREVMAYVPYVVGEILKVTRDIIRLGASRIIIPGDFPIGCFPRFLATFPSDDPSAYDGKGCLRSYNEFSTYHNKYLQMGIANLRQEFQNNNVTILYGDYYGAFQSILDGAKYHGFEQDSLLRACCGIGGPYNYNATHSCGSPGVPVCANVWGYLHWDGVHLTQQGYSHLSSILVREFFHGFQCTCKFSAL